MARVSYLLDTDILIDWLRGESWTKSLLRAQDTVFYCASITRKELLNMPGLKDSERQRILGLLRYYVHAIFVDQAISTASYELQSKYAVCRRRPDRRHSLREAPASPHAQPQTFRLHHRDRAC
jgi:predicted nucleic acid-binding protein